MQSLTRRASASISGVDEWRCQHVVSRVQRIYRNSACRVLPKVKTSLGHSLSCTLQQRPTREISAGLFASISDLIDTVDVEVERAPRNSRLIYAGVDVDAPIEAVWRALTDYDHLHHFIPGLAENRCLERRERGCKLLQVGEQDIALGAKFRARVILDIQEHCQGAPAAILRVAGSEGGEQLFPEPRSPLRDADCRDILFVMLEGDFQMWLPVQLIQSRIEGETQRNLVAVRLHSEALARAAAGAA